MAEAMRKCMEPMQETAKNDQKRLISIDFPSVSPRCTLESMMASALSTAARSAAI